MVSPKRILLSTLFLILLIQLAISQNFKTILKTGIESGYSRTDIIGSGIISRCFLNVTASRKSKLSAFKFNARFSPEFYGFENTISGVRVAIGLDLKTDMLGIPLQFSVSGRHHYHHISSRNNQNYYEFTGKFETQKTILNKIQISLSTSVSNRQLAGNNDYKIIYNIIQPMILYKTDTGFNFGAGWFMEIMSYTIADIIQSKKNRRAGPLLEVNYYRGMIMNGSYRYGKNSYFNYYDHQFSFIAGKYLSEKISLFVILYYIWRDDRENTVFEDTTIAQLESLNNASVKIAYDIDKRKHVYIKLITEEESLAINNKLITSWQLLGGFQQSF